MVIAVGMMIGGSSIAAFFDFSWDVSGYVLVMLNNAFTAFNGVYMKKALSSDVLKKNNMAILYYNSVFSAILMFIYFTIEATSVYYHNQYVLDSHNIIPINHEEMMKTGRSLVDTGAEVQAHSEYGMNQPLSLELQKSTLDIIFEYPKWNDKSFVCMFFMGAILGSVLNYSIFLCTQYNSALTTAVIGCLKNVATSYLGMILFPDFVFNIPNFLGINISIAGSLYFTYYQLYLKNKK